VQSYDGKLPEEIYEQYMIGWKKVKLVPNDVNLSKLPENLKEGASSA